MLLSVIGSTLTNLVALFLIPLVVYSAVQAWRWKRPFGDSLRRLGLQKGSGRFIGYCVLASLALIGALLLWPPPVALFTQEGSAQRIFLGAGLNGPTVLATLSYAVIQTGFSEEFFFRGLVTGALARRMSAPRANLLQAALFLLPHLPIVFVAPELWRLLLFVVALALFAGWVRIESGSILGPWILHASVNTTVALSIAIRSSA